MSRKPPLFNHITSSQICSCAHVTDSASCGFYYYLDLAFPGYAVSDCLLSRGISLILVTPASMNRLETANLKEEMHLDGYLFIKKIRNKVTRGATAREIPRRNLFHTTSSRQRHEQRGYAKGLTRAQVSRRRGVCRQNTRFQSWPVAITLKAR